MDHDKLVEEMQRLQNTLAELDTTSDAYDVVLGRLAKLNKIGIEFDEACDKQCERQIKLQNEEDNSSKEYDLKVRELDIREREIEQKAVIEAQKIDENAAEFAARRRIEKWQAIWDLVKMGLATGCTAALIVFTGRTEQHAILGQHQWSLLTKAPKI